MKESFVALDESARPLVERGILPQATYFATVRVDERAVDFCRSLPHVKRVVAIPSSVFYDSDAGDHFVRFAFCKRPEVLRQALGPDQLCQRTHRSLNKDALASRQIQRIGSKAGS